MFHIAQPEKKPHIPSILESALLTTLLRPFRKIIENRLDNFICIISYRRIRWMPLFHEKYTIQCTCNKLIDIYGDHFFSCRKYNKIAIHNHIRDTTHFITLTIGTHASSIPSKDACKLEETNLLSFPFIRPGGITLH